MGGHPFFPSGSGGRRGDARDLLRRAGNGRNRHLASGCLDDHRSSRRSVFDRDTHVSVGVNPRSRRRDDVRLGHSGQDRRLRGSRVGRMAGVARGSNGAARRPTGPVAAVRSRRRRGRGKSRARRHHPAGCRRGRCGRCSAREHSLRMGALAHERPRHPRRGSRDARRRFPRSSIHERPARRRDANGAHRRHEPGDDRARAHAGFVAGGRHRVRIHSRRGVGRSVCSRPRALAGPVARRRHLHLCSRARHPVDVEPRRVARRDGWARSDLRRRDGRRGGARPRTYVLRSRIGLRRRGEHRIVVHCFRRYGVDELVLRRTRLSARHARKGRRGELRGDRRIGSHRPGHAALRRDRRRPGARTLGVDSSRCMADAGAQRRRAGDFRGRRARRARRRRRAGGARGDVRRLRRHVRRGQCRSGYPARRRNDREHVVERQRRSERRKQRSRGRRRRGFGRRQRRRGGPGQQQRRLRRQFVR